MKNKRRKQRMTLLVLRDAQHSVKQVHLSKPLMIAVPAAAILSISSLIVSMQINSARTISELEQQLTLKSLESLKMEVTVTNKEEAIERLNKAIIQLSSEAAQTKTQMKRVKELELELQQFIQKHGSAGEKTSSLSLDSGNVGGEYIAVHENEMLNLAEETKDDFEAIQDLIKTMESHIPKTLDQAVETQSKREGNPTQWPTLSKRLTSSFGYRHDPFNGRSAYHAGIDIAGERGDPVFAAGSGTVTTAERSGVRGLYIVVRHPNGLETWYMHLDSLDVQAGDQVGQGERIGRLGNTGRSTGPHLHFQVVKNNQTVNPLPYVQ
ncbi:peptidoglycan DD-metalloendopeptidase family protein [Paenibacillus sp. N3/727]|uniref:M23 family metallopeptidase n=1 Tax=Paenibacillus sp. N3/727 TaxID=2925845 RepID=UPI001F53B511|nr:M23 family metallopeptidase [Paenibacillus sp. N3/727]UNK17617.1 peptidoglycan DD-metalloendopeptidase family protein [Paenibacillus sp. N3/727]